MFHPTYPQVFFTGRLVYLPTLFRGCLWYYINTIHGSSGYKCEWVLLGFIKVEIYNWIFRGIVEQSELSFTSGFFFRMAFIAMKNLPRSIYVDIWISWIYIYISSWFFATGIPIVQAGFHGMSVFLDNCWVGWWGSHKHRQLDFREYATVADRKGLKLMANLHFYLVLFKHPQVKMVTFQLDDSKWLSHPLVGGHLVVNEKQVFHQTSIEQLSCLGVPGGRVLENSGFLQVLLALVHPLKY